MRDPDDLKEEIITALRSEPLSFVLESVRAFGLRDAPSEGRLLAGTPKGIDNASRMGLIAAVRAGEQVELEVPAITYRQKVGKPNRNGLRFKASKLAKIARSFTGKPALVDHRSRMQSARIGTILSSELVDGALDDAPDGAAFRQVFRVVKPDAVISVLDGTIDRFSIGWAATGPVICSVHGTEVWDKCSCWPLDVLEIEGNKVTVEYEFTSAEGDETSSVNTPAVAGTKIEDVRSLLAAEIRPHLTRAHLTPAPTRSNPGPGAQMPFAKLAAILSLATLNDHDEDRAVEVVRVMHGKLAANEAELAIWRERATTAEGALATATASLAETAATKLAGDVDVIIESAYKAGKLAIKRDAEGKRVPATLETGLRGIAKALGVEALRGHVKDLPVIVPVGQRSIADKTESADPTGFELDDRGIVPSDLPGEVLASVANQLGLDPKDVAGNAAMIAAAGSRRNRFSKGA